MLSFIARIDLGLLRTYSEVSTVLKESTVLDDRRIVQLMSVFFIQDSTEKQRLFTKLQLGKS